MELNPGFDGKVTGAGGKVPPKVDKGAVTWFELVTKDVTDISPVRALTGLKVLNSRVQNRSMLTDLVAVASGCL